MPNRGHPDFGGAGRADEWDVKGGARIRGHEDRIHEFQYLRGRRQFPVRRASTSMRGLRLRVERLLLPASFATAHVTCSTTRIARHALTAETPVSARDAHRRSFQRNGNIPSQSFDARPRHRRVADECRQAPRRCAAKGQSSDDRFKSSRDDHDGSVTTTGDVFHGQTSWQTSQPKMWLPMAPRCPSGIDPRYSIVR